MDFTELTSIFCSRPQNFMWLLGAGASRSAGLPSATDVIWDLKLRHYCRQENQDISTQDIQNEGVRSRIQAYMDSRGFPADGDSDEYAIYFEKIFGSDLERQRRYLNGILSEKKVTLSAGNRVFGALLAEDLCRVAFTTNFDSVVEKSVAYVSGKSISAFHLEGARAATHALNNEEFPIYCKLHGDFRYENLKNLPADLEAQNDDLAKCFQIAGARYGIIVSGYSGRDSSVLKLFRSVLNGPNPFPHGLYWTGINPSSLMSDVQNLLQEARAKGVDAQYVSIETFDALLLRLWRNTENKSSEVDAKVRKLQLTPAKIPLPSRGSTSPLLRLNALPILSLPTSCNSVVFRNPKNWDDVYEARRRRVPGNCQRSL